ncbi:facilitated trehalose transporter Tret1-like [Bombyx mandarina]|uniref:Facilitated trehalose transporter Tret1-like n=1 Tax=Bombyx mandarina TaxID=7092 RepID=A0A6J2JHK7_BOMMA|nr:facilitated trehalose transporter Tret1-like [Bombyx mandarina]
MDSNYKEVSTRENYGSIKKCSWMPFIKQFLVCSGVWTIYFTLGMATGAPTVFIPQLRKEANSTEAVSEEMESWLSSVIGYGGIPWVFLLPVFTEFIGRKIPFIILCVNSLVAYVVFYCSTNTTHILISEIMQGMAQTGAHTILPVIITEYTSVKYRGIFLTIKSASFFWGIWASNAIGTFYYWKNIGIFAFVCSAFTVTVLIWPESPYWLATKGRFDECTASYRWLKGYDKESEEELEYLINSQKEYRKCHADDKTTWRWRLNNFGKTLLCAEFYKPVLLCMLMMSLNNLSGKIVFSMYAINIIKKITDSESIAYKGMLVLDGVTVLGMYVGCLLANFLRRRTQLLVASTLGMIFLYVISLYLYLVKQSIISENNILSIALLIMFSVTISCGPIIMTTSIYGELIPLQFKSSAMFVMGLFSDILMATVLKVSPFIFRVFGFHGACLFYGISVSICVLILFKYLPETKDKSLQEIECYFKDKSKDEMKELMDLKKSEQNKSVP